jgi:phosphotriesterase-related protein
MQKLHTTLGALGAESLGMILPHEHVFVDLKTWDQPGYAEGDPAEVIAVVGPQIARAREAGITAIVECSTVGVGRRADILRAVSQAARFPLLAPTGVYREPWIPPWVHEAPMEALRDWMTAELLGDIEGTGVQAGWIKLSAGDNGMTTCEEKVLRAAASAGAEVNAVIGSHTIRGRVVKDQVSLIESAGYAPDRFIWIHAHVEPDFAMNIEMARRGVWIEYDGIGDEEKEEEFVRRVLRMLEAGLGEHVLLSQDRGWYLPKPYTYIADRFIPRLRSEGVDERAIRLMTVTNPFNAFAR